ncbi:MAG: hypothetical protein QXQ60_00050 [Thermofilum sp.]
MLTLSSRLDAVDKKLLYLLYAYGRAVSKRRIHQLVYELQTKHGVNLGFKFLGSPPYSQDLEERLESLVSKGFLKKLYIVGSAYTTLYKPFYAVADKGVKAIEKRDFSKGDQEAIEKLVAEYRRDSSATRKESRGVG